jgi:hypothetical protein
MAKMADIPPIPVEVLQDVYKNTFAGKNAGTYFPATETSLENTAFGEDALKRVSNTKHGTAFGYGALSTNNHDDAIPDSGYYNTGIGCRALFSNTKGDHNTALGFQSATYNTTGKYITAIGEDALYNNTTGNSNTGVGCRALQNNTSGESNTAVGSSAGYTGTTNGNVTTDTNLTLIGAGVSKDTANILNNSTALGSGAKVTKSNEVVLGNESVDTIKMGGTTKTPSSSTDTGVKGEWCWNVDYIYVCIDTNTWKRTALSTW